MKYLLFLKCVAMFIEARGVLWGVKSEINHDQHTNSDSNPPLTTDLEDCDVIKNDKATRRDKGQ